MDGTSSTGSPPGFTGRCPESTSTGTGGAVEADQQVHEFHFAGSPPPNGSPVKIEVGSLNVDEQSAGFETGGMRGNSNDGESGEVANGKSELESNGEIVGEVNGDVLEEIGGGNGIVGSEREAEMLDLSNNEKDSEMDSMTIEKISGGNGVVGSVVDDTAVVDLSKNERDSEMDSMTIERRKLEAKREKRRRRRLTKADRKAYEGNPVEYKRAENGMTLMYSRKEMEVLRYFNAKGQKELWREMYSALPPSVRSEYDELSVKKKKKQYGARSEHRCDSDVLGSKQTCHGMKLHHVEDSVKNALFRVTHEDVAEERRFWQYALMGAVVGAHVSLSQMENFVEARWNEVTLPTVHSYEDRIYLFRFNAQSDMEHILQSGPWTVVEQKQLILKPWTVDNDISMSYLMEDQRDKEHILQSESREVEGQEPVKPEQSLPGAPCTQPMDGDSEILSSVDHACNGNNNGVGDDCLCEEYDEDEDSDDDYSSIQRPAFKVLGEPDFDAGPPEDGLEYLRRVRWEAAQIPNVKVAKLDESKLTKEQSVYMPEIPEIEKCPEHLLPSMQWEEEFLSDFSELRLTLSRLDESQDIWPVTAQSTSEPIHTDEAGSHSSPESKKPDGPTLSAILKIDPVTRVNSLKRQITLFEAKDELSRNECMWLFAFCAAIDTPLDADTSAALRGLLRKCSKLRAGKSELDDEAVMLNLIVTISGKYFGQSEGHV